MSEKIIETIRKLLALATSDNEAEASLAASKAHELLRAHNLSLTDLERSQAHLSNKVYLRATRVEAWKIELLEAVTRTNYCRLVWYTHTLKKRRGKRRRALNERTWCVVGREHNAAACEVMADYLFEAVLRLSERWRRANRGSVVAYRLGVVATLARRLAEIRARDADEAATRDLVLSEDALLSDFLVQARKISLRSAAVVDLEAYGQGTDDGRGISLATQLSNRGRPLTQALLI